MPHIVIKAIKGASEAQVKEAALQISKVVEKTMGKADKHISVSYEGYSFGEWEGVYNEFIKDKDNIVKQPGYTNPVTFD
ncbi:MAG: 4-oxalocrotonate tautomerase [Oscillospiraceae bacterium]|jgi:phenylpyruvate tautomerase PptA (4-oxalocrotonate tautomerase family)|nr:4-oxalocrotonate tautomerase [Oscillospiraceae bacterium]